MPLFSFSCNKCGAEPEILVRGSDKPVCPSCGSDDLVKQMSAFAPVGASASAPAAPPCASGNCCQPGACPFN